MASQKNTLFKVQGTQGRDVHYMKAEDSKFSVLQRDPNFVRIKPHRWTSPKFHDSFICLVKIFYTKKFNSQFSDFSSREIFFQGLTRGFVRYQYQYNTNTNSFAHPAKGITLLIRSYLLQRMFKESIAKAGSSVRWEVCFGQCSAEGCTSTTVFYDLN